ncbi:MAG: hypothetical protein ACJA08_000574 [Cyclobacteriaceae bacterium]
MVKKTAYFLFLFSLQYFSHAQPTSVQKSTAHSVITNQPITAIAIKSELKTSDEVMVKIGQDTLYIPIDPDAPDFTYFLSLGKVFEGIQVSMVTPGSFEIYLINSGESPTLSSPISRKNQDPCNFEIQAISQSEWRSGLTPPSFSRSFTAVKHVVVHHAAGSNTNMNYTQVVRDIYVYHTEVNGWSDIGYNYLIAQNGDIYAGRDPADGEQDNVLGAHFCGSNSGTMGICLLGNYETATPTDQTWNSLQTLVSFKLDKEELDPKENYPHTFGSIGSIVGHRDGCSTLCPGENVYNQLIDLRSEIADQIESCGDKSLAFLANRRSVSLFQEVTFFNSSEGYDSYQWLIPGAEPTSADWLMSGTTMYTQAGIFGVSLIGLINGILLDTLTLENYIEVEKGAIVAPNPVASNESITIQSENVFLKINLYNLLGDEFLLKSVNGINTFSIPDLESGVYILKIPFGKNFKEEKIIVL